MDNEQRKKLAKDLLSALSSHSEYLYGAARGDLAMIGVGKELLAEMRKIATSEQDRRVVDNLSPLDVNGVRLGIEYIERKDAPLRAAN